MSTPTQPDVVLALEQVSCVVQDTVLVHPFSARVSANEVVAVLGPSGSGKSSLLRLVNRLAEPSGGTLRLHNTDVFTLAPQVLRQRVGLVMQQPHLFPGTVESNLQFGPTQQGRVLSKKDIQNLLDQVSFAGKPEASVETLSGGEAQRVSLARTLANQPDVLLLDEPTSALDEATRLRIEETVRQWVKQKQHCALWVTHDLEQARRIADRAWLLHNGNLVKQGPMEEVLDAFSTLT
ncbi:MAG: ATP-binding cassette domain-containing protein [Deltaproteobacteria bacterium]|nr:MAG: ATP-binding cassette domain-containing protein [Deltaproteobacteria bacterium]